MKSEPMTSELDQKFDMHMRQLHADALTHVAPQTLARLRSARHGATAAKPAQGFNWRWTLAGAAPLVLAVAIGLPMLGRQTPPASRPAVAATVSDDDYTVALDENPELYLWLAADGQQLAME